ncbi:restriction endonuclease [Campylobacter sp. 19-13652]|uniref:restriction endonuclease n=1 Tax=Campylobacter sp. 19-13652 TaxID=2840180 RepID=UPI001C75BDD4|nr:restriction endonuclease [Campylobacter sp. 19-13652]BCX78661.1 hypothetical protein LBC_01230 [Campylobacter sp. 19-13652]
MKEIKQVVEAGVKNLFENTMGLKISVGKSVGKGFYTVSIPVSFETGVIEFYLFLKRPSLEAFAQHLFGDDEVSEGDLEDLSKEAANQIIGKAKNLLNEKNESKYSLGTPTFLGSVENTAIKFNEKFIYKLNNRTFFIGYIIK